MIPHMLAFLAIAEHLADYRQRTVYDSLMIPIPLPVSNWKYRPQQTYYKYS